MANLNIYRAVEYNPLILIIFPLIFILVFNDIYIIVNRELLNIIDKQYKKQSLIDKILNNLYNFKK